MLYVSSSQGFYPNSKRSSNNNNKLTVPCCTNTYTLCVWVCGCEYYTCVFLPSPLVLHTSLSVACKCMYVYVCMYVVVHMCDNNFLGCILAFKVLLLPFPRPPLRAPVPNFLCVTRPHFSKANVVCSVWQCALRCVCVIWAPKTTSSSEFSWICGNGGGSPSCKIEIVIFIFLCVLFSYLHSTPFPINIILLLLLLSLSLEPQAKPTPKCVCARASAWAVNLPLCCCDCCCFCCYFYKLLINIKRATGVHWERSSTAS